MKTTCVIIDDEPLAIELIESYIEQVSSLQLMATFKNAVNASEYIRNNPVDLLFLDIQMPMLSGIDFLKSANLSPKVILTTAYREYALEGFELDVVDYLLKPITFDRFFKAIDKYFDRVPALPILKAAASEDVPTNDYMYVKADKKHVRINFQDVLYVESIKDYLKIYTTEGTVVVKEKISALENQLPGNSFLRVHRSYIVNLQKITAYTNYDIEISAIEIPIGGMYKQQVLKILNR